MLQEELHNSGKYVEPTGEELAQIASAAANESSFGCESDSLNQSLLKSASLVEVPEVGDVKSSMGGADGGNGDVRQELLSSVEEEKYATPEGASANADAITSTTKNSKNSSAERPTAAAPAAQAKGTAAKSKKKKKRRNKKKGRASRPSKSSSTGIPFCRCISTEFLNLVDEKVTLVCSSLFSVLYCG